MSVQTDVKAGSLALSGTVFAGRTRVRGLIIEPGTGPGSVVLKDGGAGGTTILTINTTALGETFNALIPASGVVFSTSVYVALTDAKVTVFYG